MHPALPLPRRSTALWLSPLVLACLFAAAVMGWAVWDERREREAERQTLITDTLSAVNGLRAQLAQEQQALAGLAKTLAERPTALLQAQPEVEQGLRSIWSSLVWLDAEHRVRAEVVAPARSSEGRSQHLQQAVGVPELQGRLVLRYSPTLLLRQAVPWWLARRYDVQLIDADEQTIAALSPAPGGLRAEARPSYRVALDDSQPGAQLELIVREPAPSGLRPLVGVLIAGFLPLSALASLGLRRQLRRTAQAEARWKGEAAWRAAVEDSALVGLRARDGQGRLLSVNRTFCEIVGWSADELVGRAPPMPYWPPDALDEVKQRSDRNLAGQAPREGYEARWRHRSGREIDVLVFETPLVDAGGRQIGWLGTILDITERKRLAEREQRQLEALAQTARLTMLGEVASTLAHELNQPLTAIASYNTGVMNSLQRLGLDDPLVLGALQRLGEQAAQAGRVVQRIRHFLTRHEPQIEACALNPVLQAALGLLAKELTQREVQVELALAADLPAVRADAVLIEQVVINLLRNAADALREQPGARRIVLTSWASAEDGCVWVSVRDNGPGLQGRSAETLFAPFYSTKAEGMGMGLAICRSIIEAHHGVLSAEPAPDGGACFRFSLPVMP